MKVWILSEHNLSEPTDDNYEIRRFVEEAPAAGVELDVVRSSQFEVVVTADGQNTLLVDSRNAMLPDVFLPRPDGIRGEYLAQAVMRQMEQAGVSVVNRVDAALTVADKLHTHQILASHGVPTPATMLASATIDARVIDDIIGYPAVIKTISGTNGRGVFLAENQAMLKDAVELAREANPKAQLIFQKFVAHKSGHDLRLVVLDNQVVASMERISQDGSFKANFSRGGAVRKHIPDPIAVSLALKTTKILGLDFAGIDLLFTEQGYTVCEANAFPGFRGLESCCDINVPRAVYSAMRRRLSARSRSWKSVIRWLSPANQMAGQKAA